MLHRDQQMYCWSGRMLFLSLLLSFFLPLTIKIQEVKQS